MVQVAGQRVATPGIDGTDDLLDFSELGVSAVYSGGQRGGRWHDGVRVAWRLGDECASTHSVGEVPRSAMMGVCECDAGE